MTYKGALIGFGNIAANGHVPAYKLNSDIEITAVFDVLADRQEACKECFPSATFYTDIDELLQKENVDFVDIVTPPASHFNYICKALEHGKHVFCEKPLVLSEDHYIKIQRLRQQQQKVVFTVHNWRYAPILIKVCELVCKGRIGEVTKVRYDVIRTKPSVSVGEEDGNWRLDPNVAGGGILIDHGWHAFYTIHDWMQGEPLWVHCLLQNRKYTDIAVEDTATVKIGYANAIIDVFFTWSGDQRRNYISMVGSKGILTVFDDHIILKSEGSEEKFEFDEGLSQGSHHPEWYSSMLAAFIQALGDNSIAIANFEDAGRCLNIISKCQLSHQRSGKQQKLISF